MNWTEYRATLANWLVITDDPGLALLDATLPAIVDYAQGRILEDSDLDFLATRTVDATARTFPGRRWVNIPTEFVIVEEVSLIAPRLQTPDSAGSKRITLLRTTQAFIDSVWPNSAQMRTPQPWQTYFAIPSQSVVNTATAAPPNTPAGAIFIAPTVDSEYAVEIRGTFDPAPPSAVNQSTFLLTYYPSLFVAASMVIATGALKQNYGSASDSPQQAVSWESVYQAQKLVATKRSQRQHSWGPGFVTAGPMPLGVMPKFEMMPPPPAPAG